VWDEVARRFRQKKLKPWIPTPVTNKFSAIGDALVSLLLRVQPEMTWRSKDANDQAQISIAETMTNVLDRVKDQTQFKFWRQELATWLVYATIPVYRPIMSRGVRTVRAGKRVSMSTN
jgi:hypothetical protein